MRRILVGILLALTLMGVLALPAFALETADVTVTATPEYLAITNSESEWVIGPVATSTTKWWTADGNAPDPEPFEDTDMKSAATNTGSIDSNISIQAENFTGTVGWTLATSVGLNTVVLGIGKTGTANKAACLKLLDNDPQELAHELAPSGHIDWCMYLDTGTFNEGSAKSTTITLTISKHTA